MLTSEEKPASVPYEIAERIRLKKAQYCRFMDTKQWEALEGLALPTATLKFYDLDGRIMNVGGVRYEFASPHAFVQTMSAVFRKARTSHIVANSEIELLSDEEASALWAMQDYLVFPSILGFPMTFLGHGHYHEIWTKKDGDWLLKSLELKRTIGRPSLALGVLSRLPMRQRGN